MLLNKISNRLKILLVSIYDSFIIIGYRKRIKKSEVDGKSLDFIIANTCGRKKCMICRRNG